MHINNLLKVTQLASGGAGIWIPVSLASIPLFFLLLYWLLGIPASLGWKQVSNDNMKWNPKTFDLFLHLPSFILGPSLTSSVFRRLIPHGTYHLDTLADWLPFGWGQGHPWQKTEGVASVLPVRSSAVHLKLWLLLVAFSPWLQLPPGPRDVSSPWPFWATHFFVHSPNSPSSVSGPFIKVFLFEPSGVNPIFHWGLDCCKDQYWLAYV